MERIQSETDRLTELPALCTVGCEDMAKAGL